ncbi:MAG TPA: hypothetical protein VGH48_02780 [Caldimonas sp.]
MCQPLSSPQATRETATIDATEAATTSSERSKVFIGVSAVGHGRRVIALAAVNATVDS